MSDTLSKDTHTIAEHHFKTRDGEHTLYVQEWGNKKGKPIMFLHGGPGSGCSDGHKKLFDPTKHYVIFHDQRGSGLSKPYASTKQNTTQKLIEDIDLIREKLTLDSFAIFGRSWGSTLALCYAIAHPEQVTHLVIGGVFLGTRPEIDWVDAGKFGPFFPDVIDTINFSKLTARDYAQMAVATLRLDDRYPELTEETFDPTASMVERSYLEKDCYLKPSYILDNAAKVICPVNIVQGRYDMMTTPINAYKLHKALPNSTLQWTIAGHSASDRSNFDVSKAILSQL